MVGADAAGVMVTFAEPFFVGSAVLVAVTSAEIVVVVDGAENNPEVDIWPAVVVQVTPVLLVPLTKAVNCWEAAEAMVALLGEMVTEMLPGAMSILRRLSPCNPLASTTHTVNGKLPVLVGVPEIKPVV
jgi:hypothetical protein